MKLNNKNYSYSRGRYSGGQALIIAVVFFLFISTAVVTAVSRPLLKDLKIAHETVNAKKTFFTAEALTEDLTYRFKEGLSADSAESLTLDGNTASAAITTTLSGKTIVTTGDVSGAIRKIQTDLIAGDGASFNYGIQTGNGGFELIGGSSINGNVYSNGNIIGDGGAVIYGSAIAANPSSVSIEQANENPVPSTDSISFGNANSTQDLGQSFQVSTPGPLTSIEFYIKKSSISSQSDPIVKIVNDSGGSPGSTVYAQGTLSTSLMTTNYGWVSVTLNAPIQLPTATTYWIVIDKGSSSATNYLLIAANPNTSYGGSPLQAKTGRVGSTWSAPDKDSYFRIKFGGGTSSINGDGYDYLRVGTGPSDIAWANTVNSTNPSGPIYCQSGAMNNGKSCDTSRTDPPPLGMPISEALIDSWKDEAINGGTITGNYSVGWAGATIGPTRITGNLTVNGGGTLILNGTVYVEGNITFSGGGKLRLAATYGTNSGVLVTDGLISISGGGQFSGSGQAGSFPLAITTSNCPMGPSCSGNNALYMSGGAGAVVLVAQNGTILMDGGTSAKALTGYKVRITNGGSVTYESGVSDLNFSSGPSGAFDITTWKEIE